MPIGIWGGQHGCGLRSPLALGSRGTHRRPVLQQELIESQLALVTHEQEPGDGTAWGKSRLRSVSGSEQGKEPQAELMLGLNPGRELNPGV